MIRAKSTCRCGGVRGPSGCSRCGRGRQGLTQRDGRKSAHARGYGRDWWAVRAAYVKSVGHRCEECGKHMRQGLNVHHITPIEDDPSRRLDLSNLQALCPGCHNREEK